MKHEKHAGFPPISDISQFDKKSGNLIERALFNYRIVVITICFALTALLGYQAFHVHLNANFTKNIPTHHKFIANYFQYQTELKRLSNAVRIAVEAGETENIYDNRYLMALQRLNDEVYNIPGVDRAFMKSLWTPSTRWLGVTEDGFDGGPVIPDDFDGSARMIEKLRENVERSGEIGQLVAPDFRSTIIYVPLLDFNTDTQKPLDYGELSRTLESLRDKYDRQGVKIHISGFAKVMGDLIDGLKEMLIFFGLAVIITATILLLFTHCVRSTLLVLGCSLVAVAWLLGMLPLMGYELNPYSILVPFLVYAIGVSHGAQKMNGIMQDIGRGTHKLVAARYTFRRLFMAGAAALLADATGFAVLNLIDIPVIQELSKIASLGVGILIFTNLALLPVLLSYTGVSTRAAARSLKEYADESSRRKKHFLWHFLDLFTVRKYAIAAIAVAVVMGAIGYRISLDLKIGDLDTGAPELRPNSRYNRDNDFIVHNYQASSDVFVVMVKTPQNTCMHYSNVAKVDDLEWTLRHVPGVEGTHSMAALSRWATAGMSEGNLKWYELIRNQSLINASAARAPRELFNTTCDLLSVYAFLKDHKADTLDNIVKSVETFAAANDSPEATFLLAAGNAGIEAATNIVVKEANGQMLAGVYLAVLILCAIAFRDWRAVLCAVLPLALTSILAEALMVMLGIGVKVATLPVIALGVGIGVDYALYIVSVTLGWLRRGSGLSMAYYRALVFTGRVVVFTGATLSLGVLTWVFSPIKFQADMGILLTFMFLWNMLGALILTPALACVLFNAHEREDAIP